AGAGRELRGLAAAGPRMAGAAGNDIVVARNRGARPSKTARCEEECMKQDWGRKVAIVGVGTTMQGLHPGRSSHQLGADALKLALADGGLDKQRLDGVVSAKQLDGSGIDPLEFSRQIGINPKVTGALDYATGGFSTQYAAM